ncbi:hypothetical protein EX30DRAFT_113870 [Ascodesmis nigricans]|uniref:C2H2-type domain-containing protein n=1 Tax=Ascodesmis nigricans TaxID=341454 RepID=A0A4S2MPV2_9PEZI|nr:hypothetical protein EX30DRAFT_113870 [Ascodesmis nigricans]
MSHGYGYTSLLSSYLSPSDNSLPSILEMDLERNVLNYHYILPTPYHDSPGNSGPDLFDPTLDYDGLDSYSSSYSSTYSVSSSGSYISGSLSPHAHHPPSTYPHHHSHDAHSPPPPERKYKCDFCSRGFDKRADIRRHEVSVHRERLASPPALHVCVFVGCSRQHRGFARIDNYKEHLRRVHGHVYVNGQGDANSSAVSLGSGYCGR